LAEDDKFSGKLTERRRLLEEHVPEARGDGGAPDGPATAGGGGGATYHRHVPRNPAATMATPASSTATPATTAVIIPPTAATLPPTAAKRVTFGESAPQDDPTPKRSKVPYTPTREQRPRNESFLQAPPEPRSAPSKRTHSGVPFPPAASMMPGAASSAPGASSSSSGSFDPSAAMPYVQGPVMGDAMDDRSTSAMTPKLMNPEPFWMFYCLWDFLTKMLVKQ
jgi:hypothetical protein